MKRPSLLVYVTCFFLLFFREGASTIFYCVRNSLLSTVFLYRCYLLSEFQFSCAFSQRSERVCVFARVCYHLAVMFFIKYLAKVAVNYILLLVGRDFRMYAIWNIVTHRHHHIFDRESMFGIFGSDHLYKLSCMSRF